MSSMGGGRTFPGGCSGAGTYAPESLSDGLRVEVAGVDTDIVFVDPGFIPAGLARASVPISPAPDGSGAGRGPDRRFDDRLRGSTGNVGKRGVLSRLEGAPGGRRPVILNMVLDGVPSSWAWARDPVTAAAPVLERRRAAQPDRSWDAELGRQFAPPGAADG